MTCIYHIYVYILYMEVSSTSNNQFTNTLYQEIIVLNVVLYNEQKSHKVHIPLLFYCLCMTIKSKLLIQ